MRRPAQLIELGQRVEIDVAIVDVEHRPRRHVLVAERRHQVLEIGLAAGKIRARRRVTSIRSRTQTQRPFEVRETGNR